MITMILLLEQDLLPQIFKCQRQLYFPSQEKSENEMNWPTYTVAFCSRITLSYNLKLYS